MRILENLKGLATRIVIVVVSVFILLAVGGCGGGGTAVAAAPKEVLLTGSLIPAPRASSNTVAQIGVQVLPGSSDVAQLGWQRREGNPTRVRVELRFRDDVGPSAKELLTLGAQLGTGRGGPEWTASEQWARVGDTTYQFIPDPQGRGGVSHWKVVRNGVEWRSIATENLWFDLSTEMVRGGTEASAAGPYADWMVRWCTQL